jgi:salicylate hydroxylase
MYRDIEEKLAARKQVKYADKFICGLPVGLKLPNGIVIGASA